MIARLREETAGAEWGTTRDTSENVSLLTYSEGKTHLLKPRAA